MTATTEAPAKPKATLNEASKTLFFIAARSHVLAEQFGIELIEHEDGHESLRFLPAVQRPWLKPTFEGGLELTFDPDEYAKTLDDCSKYTRHMRLFILNAWNPTAARGKGWHFDFFAALRGLDAGNAAAIAHFTTLQVWP